MDFKETEAYKLFLKQLADIKPRIQNLSLSELKDPQVRSFIHALKGNSGLFGLSEISDLAKDLGDITDGDSIERFNDIRSKLIEVIDNALLET